MQITDITVPQHPFGQQIMFNDIADQFSQCHSWEDKYRQLVLLAKKLPPLAEIEKQTQLEISGCENKVWLNATCNSDGSLHFYGDSEGRIVKGLLAILLAKVEGKKTAELLTENLNAPFMDLGLSQQLSQSRQNGIQALIDRIKSIAQNYAQESLVK